MRELKEEVKKIDWKNGIITQKEAERFINRFATVLLKQALANKEKVK